MFDELAPIALAIYILSLAMSFAIGANDAANGLATCYGSNALKLIPLCLCGALFEFIGACWGSQKISKNLAGDIIENLDDMNDMYQIRLMLAVSIAAFCFIMASSVFGMPISGTHTVISALVGAGLVGAGASEINWMQVIKIVSSWVISPLLSSAMTLLLIMICCATTLGGFSLSLKTRLVSLSLITASSFALTNFMSITLFQVVDTINPNEYWSIPCSFFAGVLVSRAILLNLIMREKSIHGFVISVLLFWDYEVFERILAEEKKYAKLHYNQSHTQSEILS